MRRVPAHYENLGAYRKALGMTQGQLSEKSGVCARSLAYYEHGTRVPRPAQQKRILKALGLRYADRRRFWPPRWAEDAIDKQDPRVMMEDLLRP